MGRILGVFCLAGLRFFLGVFFHGEEQLHILLCFFQFLHFIPCLTVGWICCFLLRKQCSVFGMENILKVFLMAFPEWLACIFMVVGLVVTALAAVRLGYGLVVAKTVYKWIVNAEEKFGSGAGAEKKAHVIAVLRGYTPDWLDWAINERTLDWIVQLVFDFTKKKLEDYMAKKSAETTTVAHFGNVGENKRND